MAKEEKFTHGTIRGIGAGGRLPYAVHFIGIGGIGMSGLAEILLNLDYKVTGSDLVETEITSRLTSLGAKIIIGHDPGNLGEAGIVVASAAVNPSNPEMIAAKERDIPVIQRAELLAHIMRLKANAIAVAGTHGKTTTTSMIAALLEKADVECTAIIGGILNRRGSNAAWGRGDLLVAEADEYARSFLALAPTMAIITNIDAEHLEIYGSLDEIKKAFIQFANKVPFYGFTILCIDDANVREILPEVTTRHITYGIAGETDYGSLQPDLLASGIRSEFTETETPEGYAAPQMVTSFDVENTNPCLGLVGKLGRLEVSALGRHNTLNAMAGVALGLGLGMDFDSIREGLLLFEGVRRRLQVRGHIGSILVIEDYAHHPTEIRATLEAVRLLPAERIVVVFQPHLYSRTKFLCDEFASAFSLADRVIVTKIYGAREKPIEGVSSANIVEAAQARGFGAIEVVEDKDAVPPLLVEDLRPGDLVLFLGAGDIGKTAGEMVEMLKAKLSLPVEG